MLKKIAIGIVILLVFIAGAAYFLFSNLDAIVKAAIEKYGTAATQTDVRLDSVKISIADGTATLNGLSIANPKGFSSAKAIYMGSISVKLDTSSITGGGPIVIRDITVEKPQVTYELANDGGSNLQTIQKNAASYSATASDASKPSPAPASPSSGAPPGNASSTSGGQERKIIINDLSIRDGQVAVSQAFLQGKNLAVGLPPIHLTNIGKDRGGATPAQIAQQVLASITATAANAASAEIAKGLGELKGGDIGNQVKGLLGR